MADLTPEQLARARELVDEVGFDLATACEVVAIQDGAPGCLVREKD